MDLAKERIKHRMALIESNANEEELCRNLIIDDTALLSVKELGEKCRNFSVTIGLDLIVVDFLTLLEGSSNEYANRWEEVYDVSKEIKELAQELQIPVIVVTIHPRKVEWRDEHRPKLDDLREWSMEPIELDSDVIMFIYRDGYYNKYSETKNRAEVIIAKNRYEDITGTVILGWDYERSSFYNV